MSELEDIKARAAERRNDDKLLCYVCCIGEVASDLDRAITIAETWQQREEAIRKAYIRDGEAWVKERDEARAELEARTQTFYERGEELEQARAMLDATVTERDEALAAQGVLYEKDLQEAHIAVLALRDAMGDVPRVMEKAKADTESYEQYRPVTSVTPTQQQEEME